MLGLAGPGVPRTPRPGVFALPARRDPISATTGDAAEAAADARSGTSAPGPDFLCVGLQKGGTQWLYDQLQGHPDFWMPPFKELHFFDRAFPDEKILKAARRFLKNPRRVAKNRAGRGEAPVDERGAAFYARVADLERKPADIEDYARLFEPKADLISGDVTPGYSTLGPDLIGALAARFGDARVCLMLREPASRLWSQWRMVNETEPGGGPAVLDFDRFRAFIDRPSVAARSFPSEIARKWTAAFGSRFRVFFLEDVAEDPDRTRADLLSFLGGDPAKPSIVTPDFNRKAKAGVARPTPRMQALLRERFAAERSRCADLFGGPATRWPDAPY